MEEKAHQDVTLNEVISGIIEVFYRDHVLEKEEIKESESKIGFAA
jgi:hypothetical protein